MKLVLIQPPIQDFYETDIRLQPIGLCYLKATILKHLPQTEVKIRDFHQGWGRKTISIPEELSYLRSYYAFPNQSPFSTFHAYYHFGADFETIACEVEKEKPDLIGISALFSPYYREVLSTASAIKKKINTPILVGGSHASACPELMLSHRDIDFVIRGEGERPVVEFLKAFSSDKKWRSVPNLGFKEDQQQILNPLEDNYGIEDLAIPDLSDFNLETYQYEGKPLSFLITSRSCPHHCSFCSVHQTFGNSFRRRSTENILEEIRTRYQQGYRVFDFEDDNLTYFREGMKKLCLELIREFQDQEIEFLAMNGISYLSLDRELMTLMRQAGFTHLNLALVSSDDSVRESTKRPHTIKKYLEVVQSAFDLGFKIVSYQILGLPNESIESMIQTLCFQAKLPILLGASPFYLTPRSPIAQLFPERSEEDVFKSRLSSMAIETKDVSRNAIYTLFITTRILNFLKSISIVQDEPVETVLDLALHSGGRNAVGARLLKLLFDEHNLYASHKAELRKVAHFDSELFLKIWNQLETVVNQEGKTIRVSKQTKLISVPPL